MLRYSPSRWFTRVISENSDLLRVSRMRSDRFKGFTAATEKPLPSIPSTQNETPSGLRQTIRRWSVKLWLWELLSLLLSSLCVGAVIMILLRYNGRPLPTWRYGITINGAVSVDSSQGKRFQALSDSNLLFADSRSYCQIFNDPSYR